MGFEGPAAETGGRAQLVFPWDAVLLAVVQHDAQQLSGCLRLQAAGAICDDRRAAMAVCVFFFGSKTDFLYFQF